VNHGWVGYRGGGENARLSDDVRHEVEQRIARRQETRGRLLAIVEVGVYENAAEPQVSFPQDALLGVESEASTISAVVARARQELATGR
jgi:hypothetical protein